MPDIDPASAYKTLTQRAAAMRAEADAARKQSVAEASADERRFGLQRDELDRERGSLARDAELADGQVKQYEELHKTMVESADQFEADIRAGKPVATSDSLWQRNVEEGRAAAEQLAERAAAARADAAATRERLAGVDRKLVDLDNEVRVAGDENQAARMAIFSLDDRARHVDEAARRYGEAAAAGDNIPERAAKELAAEQAMQNANATAVDRDAIRRVIPTFPDETPGLTENPWPPAAEGIGPEETLDPFAGDTDAAAAGDAAGTSTDQMAYTDPFDGSTDDASAEGTDVSGASADGNDAAFLDSEAAQLGDGQAAATIGGFDEYSGAAAAGGSDGYASAETMAGYDEYASVEASGGADAAAADTVGGYGDGGYGDGASAESTGGYEDYAATADSSGGYGEPASATEALGTLDATAAYDDYAATADTADTGSYDEYASSGADTGYDDGSGA
jgi:hypothetical protein